MCCTGQCKILRRRRGPEDNAWVVLVSPRLGTADAGYLVDAFGTILVPGYGLSVIVAGARWPLHPHQDIESLTYVVEGQFLHADSLGNNGHLEPGAAQVMTFSHRGDLHSEKNGSPDEAMRFIQFWILPSVRGLETRVQQRQYQLEDRTDRWLLIMVRSAPMGWTSPRTLERWLRTSPSAGASNTPSVRARWLTLRDRRAAVARRRVAKDWRRGQAHRRIELGLATDVAAGCPGSCQV